MNNQEKVIKRRDIPKQELLAALSSIDVLKDAIFDTFRDSESFNNFDGFIENFSNNKLAIKELFLNLIDSNRNQTNKNIKNQKNNNNLFNEKIENIDKIKLLNRMNMFHRNRLMQMLLK